MSVSVKPTIQAMLFSSIVQYILAMHTTHTHVIHIQQHQPSSNIRPASWMRVKWHIVNESEAGGVQGGRKSWNFLKHIFAIIIRPPLHVNAAWCEAWLNSLVWKILLFTFTICLGVFSALKTRALGLQHGCLCFCSDTLSVQSVDVVQLVSCKGVQTAAREHVRWNIITTQKRKKNKAGNNIIVLKFSWTNEFFTFFSSAAAAVRPRDASCRSR